MECEDEGSFHQKPEVAAALACNVPVSLTVHMHITPISRHGSAHDTPDSERSHYSLHHAHMYVMDVKDFACTVM
jgi:hypothetical protein